MDQVTGPGGLFEVSEEFISYPNSQIPHHQGVKYKVFKNAPQTMMDLYRVASIRGFGKKDFLVYNNDRYSFESILKRSSELAYTLVHKFGIEKDDKVAILSANCPEYIVAFIAATSIGAVAVPMNSWWTSKELTYGVNHSDCKILFCDEKRYHEVAKVRSLLTQLHHVVVWHHGLTNAHFIDYNEALRFGSGKSMPQANVSKDDVAIIMYTSGTTGHPKGVVQTHRGVTHALNAIILKALMGRLTVPDNSKSDSRNEQDQPSCLLTVPLFHATGLHTICLLSLLTGRKIVMMKKWDALEALKLIEREKLTTITAVPTMIMQLMQHPDFSKYDTSSLRGMFGGGAASPPSLLKDIRNKLRNASPGQGYGMTETNAAGTMTDATQYQRKPTSCGSACPCVTIEIWDEQGNQLPPDGIGRVMIKGPNIMKEYYKNPKATIATISPTGYLDTGDIGRMDDEGFLFILDRAKDIIIRGGENISCVEVESAIYELDSVQECAVFGVPHPTLQEEVAVAIYPKPGASVTLEQVRQACEILAPYKRPMHLFLWEKSLPRGATGKVVKREIRDMVQKKSKL